MVQILGENTGKIVCKSPNVTLLWPLLEYGGIHLYRLLLWKAQYLSIFYRGGGYHLLVWEAQYLSIFYRGGYRLFLWEPQYLSIFYRGGTAFLKIAQYLSIWVFLKELGISVSQYLLKIPAIVVVLSFTTV